MRATLALLLAASAAAARDDGEAVMETYSGTQKSGHCLAIFHTEYDFHGRDHVAALHGNPLTCKSERELFGVARQRLKSGTFWVHAGCRLQIYHLPSCQGFGADGYKTFFDLDATGRTTSLTHVISEIGGDARLLRVAPAPYFGSALCRCGSAALSRWPGVNATSSAVADDASEEHAAAEEDDEDDDDEESADRQEDDGEAEAADDGDEEDEEEEKAVDEEEEKAVDEEEAKEEVGLVAKESWTHRRRAFAAKEHRPCSYVFRRDLWFGPYKQGKVRRNKCVTFSTTYGLKQTAAAAIVDGGCRLSFYRKKRCQGSSRWSRWRFTRGIRVLGTARMQKSLGSWEGEIASVGCRCVR